jgi:NADH-quinone oxidoreductase subunit G
VDWTFGTEELSSYSELIRQAETAPILCMHPEDAERSGLGGGNRAAIHLPKGTLAVQVRISNAMASGVLVLPRHRQLDWRKLSGTPVYLAPHQIGKVQE